MQFTAYWREKVFDTFGDFECINPQEPLTLEADTLEAAKAQAVSRTQAMVNEKRNGVTNGYFIPHVQFLRDAHGVDHAC